MLMLLQLLFLSIFSAAFTSTAGWEVKAIGFDGDGVERGVLLMRGGKLHRVNHISLDIELLAIFEAMLSIKKVLG